MNNIDGRKTSDSVRELLRFEAIEHRYLLKIFQYTHFGRNNIKFNGTDLSS